MALEEEKTTLQEDAYNAAKVCLQIALKRCNPDQWNGDISIPFERFLKERFDEFREEIAKINNEDWEQEWIDEFRTMLLSIQEKIGQSSESSANDDQKARVALLTTIKTFLRDLAYSDLATTFISLEKLLKNEISASEEGIDTDIRNKLRYMLTGILKEEERNPENFWREDQMKTLNTHIRTVGNILTQSNPDAEAVEVLLQYISIFVNKRNPEFQGKMNQASYQEPITKARRMVGMSALGNIPVGTHDRAKAIVPPSF